MKYFCVIHRPVKGMEESRESFQLLTEKELKDFRIARSFYSMIVRKVDMEEFTITQITKSKYDYIMELFGKTFGDFPDYFLAFS